MDYLYAIFLGLIEGLTEFIPVSSTGHLILAKDLLGLVGDNWDTFIVLIQLGAVLAVVALYFARLWAVVVALPTSPEARHFAISVIVAFIPAVVLGLLLHDFIKHVLFESPLVICWSLIIGGVVLVVIDRLPLTPTHHDSMRIPLLTALGIGLFQCLAMIPGTSRSGSTIVGALLLKTDKRAAAEFSFFLAIPTMVAAFAFDLLKNHDKIGASGAGVIAVGFVASFIFGWFVVKVMLDFVSKRGYALFGWWRIIVGLAGLVAFWHA